MVQISVVITTSPILVGHNWIKARIHQLMDWWDRVNRRYKVAHAQITQGREVSFKWFDYILHLTIYSTLLKGPWPRSCWATKNKGSITQNSEHNVLVSSIHVNVHLQNWILDGPHSNDKVGISFPPHFRIQFQWTVKMTQHWVIEIPLLQLATIHFLGDEVEKNICNTDKSGNLSWTSIPCKPQKEEV